MAEERNFKVGDKVTVFGSSLGPGWSAVRVLTVKRVMKRFVELEDGSQWDNRWGNPYPRSSGYHRPVIHAWKEEHDREIEAIKRHQLVRNQLDHLVERIRSVKGVSEMVQNADVYERILRAFAITLSDLERNQNRR